MDDFRSNNESWSPQERQSRRSQQRGGARSRSEDESEQNEHSNRTSLIDSSESDLGSLSDIDHGFHSAADSPRNKKREKGVRFTQVEKESDITVTDSSGDESQDDLLEDRPNGSSFSPDSAKLDITNDERKEFIVAGKSLRGTKARNKYIQDDSDYEQDFSSRRTHRLRNREPVNYTKQLMPANFTQILEKESKALDGYMDQVDRHNEDRSGAYRDGFGRSRPKSRKYSPSNGYKNPQASNNRLERLNEVLHCCSKSVTSTIV